MMIITTTRHDDFVELRLILLKLVDSQRRLIVLLSQSWRLATRTTSTVMSVTFPALGWLVVTQRIVSRWLYV